MRDTGRRRATARDVAEAVGCSSATVSLVVNGKASGRVTAETEARVWATVEALGYRVNTAASALASGQPATIAFVSPDPTNPFFSLVLEGMLERLVGDYTVGVVVPSRGDDYDPRTVEHALAGDLAALVLASPGRALLDRVSSHAPTVLLDAGAEREGMASIEIDLSEAARDLADHLAGLGHEVVAYVGVDRDKASLHRRREGLAAQLSVRGSRLVGDLLLPRMTIGAARLGAAERFPQWLDEGVSAVVCADDLLAFGVMQATADRGLRVPADMSVSGFNDVPYASMTAPTLTSIDLRARELGNRTASALQSLLEGQLAAPQVVGSTLIVRESTGPAPRR